jgi:tetratricopeptide (TPR) repeat protein
VPDVPALVQAEDHCGPTSLASLLAWAGRPETPEALADLVYLPGRGGTLPMDLSREIRARGLLAYRVRPDLPALLREVAAGSPALVLENRGLGWAPVWHYSVLTGYDLEESAAVLHAGEAEAEAVSLATFARTWSRGGSFALLALPAGHLPAGDDPEGILSALSDLEETGSAEEAARGYEAFLARWPDDWRGAFGWGNALYAAGDRTGSEEALRRAHGTAPERPEPLNNLAWLAAQDGRTEEARALAAMAVENAVRANLDPTPFQDTLEQVSERH